MRLRLMGTITGAALLAGCSTPRIEYVKTATYEYSTSGFPIPLEQPLPAEQGELLLRYRPHFDKVLTYQRRQLSHVAEAGKTSKARIETPSHFRLKK
jgi:hypothetical protein